MRKLLGAVQQCGTLTGCAGMNSDFGCNKTAAVQCLSKSDASHLASKHQSLDDLNLASACQAGMHCKPAHSGVESS